MGQGISTRYRTILDEEHIPMMMIMEDVVREPLNPNSETYG
jgi:hypothetical protein